jgi:peptidoglycan hydrolase-like protein with peptidoglycan-binding domain
MHVNQNNGARAALGRRKFIGLSAATGAGLLLPGITTLTVAHASAASGQAAPLIHPTSEWGARPPSEAVTLADKPPTKLFIHHTDTPNTTDYSLAHGIALAKSIQNYHMDKQHWIDTGQHFTLTRGTHVLEGRHRSIEALQNGHQDVLSAHCVGQNDKAIGIENEGTYMQVAPLAEHYAALVDLSSYICAQYGIRAYQIYGHRNFNNTDCPGDQLYALLPQLRSEVAARIGGDPAQPVWPVLKKGAKSGQVVVLQLLLRAWGSTIAADGDFGSGTDAAVRAYQQEKTASVDGIAGGQTWNQLANELSKGASGEAVKAVQTRLVAKGVQVGVDGAFGPGTEAGVKQFQTASTLPPDGIVDPRTLSRLVAL